jgi:hypothetical protein
VGLRELPAKDLRNYAFSAMTTQGTLDDFRYFLPRLFEAIVTDLDGICPEVLFGKLRYAERIESQSEPGRARIFSSLRTSLFGNAGDRGTTKAWSDAAADAIEGYLDAFWRTALGGYPIEGQLPPFFEIETVLACIARAGEPLHAFLESWTRTETLPADQLLIQFVTFHSGSFLEGRTLNEGFWRDCEAQGMELRTWLLRPDTMRRVERCASAVPEDGYEHLFAPALEVLRREAAG